MRAVAIRRGRGDGWPEPAAVPGKRIFISKRNMLLVNALAGGRARGRRRPTPSFPAIAIAILRTRSTWRMLGPAPLKGLGESIDEG